jgi:hypothetical protein
MPRTVDANANPADQGVLRQQARLAIQSRKLPDRLPESTLGGPGIDAPCAVCDRPVRADELEIELKYSDRAKGAASYHFHVRCHRAWEIECLIFSRAKRHTRPLTDPTSPSPEEPGPVKRGLQSEPNNSILATRDCETSGDRVRR